MNLAIVADWLPVFAGAEHSIAEFHALWPDAPLFTTIAHRGRLGPVDVTDIRTTNLQRWYGLLRRHQVLLPWMPHAIEDIDLRGFDTILSSSHAVGKGIIPPADAVHICYCHTPMRYAWEMEEEYLEDFSVPRFLRPSLKRMLKKLRRWDLQTAKRVDVFLANSAETQERIRRIYGRESTVIPPPVHERFFQKALNDERRAMSTSDSSQPTAHSYFLAVGRLVPYKRFDLLIEVANIAKLSLRIVGTGQDERRLKKIAGPTVDFLGHIADENLPSLYAGARALLFPQHEDAGIVPLEAQACGTPIIAFAGGGALDAVIPGKTGAFFREQTAEALRLALEECEKISFDRESIREHAQQFSAEKFRERIRGEVTTARERFLRCGGE